VLRHAHPLGDAAVPEQAESTDIQIVGVVDPDIAGGDIGVIATRAAQLVEDGADLVDVDTVVGGGRPLDVRRLARLVRRLVAEGVPVGVTTTSADVVVGAVDAGATVVSDPSGGGLDRFMPQIVAAAGVRYVLGQSVARTRVLRPATPLEFRVLAERRALTLLEAGVDPELIVLDSGVGEYSQPGSEWGVLDHLHRLAGLGCPVFVDASWPALFTMAPGSLDDAGVTDEDDAAAIGVCVVAASANAWGVRVSNVARASAVLRGRSARSRHGAGAQTR
jgi:dihydropteroate synthase